ncbi:hypothetical protein PR202_ga12609 [Eleusine coracana subsp. coracana]|uniref:Uncharacterized protein n=1 Tax=Eleusine coracana subsp. coracana TaxID=191504 RepID=A0AAV5CBZ1_ELECO|nr:hypothetical protein PR202_ga12609 [Eleusine coracana subsp. coracana]
MSISEAATVASEQGRGDGELEKFIDSKENMAFNDFDEQSTFIAIQDRKFTSVRKFNHDFLEQIGVLIDTENALNQQGE